jgi:hypothetical protein
MSTKQQQKNWAQDKVLVEKNGEMEPPKEARMLWRLILLL